MEGAGLPAWVAEEWRSLCGGCLWLMEFLLLGQIKLPSNICNRLLWISVIFSQYHLWGFSSFLTCNLFNSTRNVIGVWGTGEEGEYAPSGVIWCGVSLIWEFRGVVWESVTEKTCPAGQLHPSHSYLTNGSGNRAESRTGVSPTVLPLHSRVKVFGKENLYFIEFMFHILEF